MRSESLHRKIYEPAVRESSHRFIFLAVWFVVFLGAFISGAPWVDHTGLLSCLLGGLMLIAPPKIALPKLWWILGTSFLVLCFASFLPAAWFPIPEWRTHLESLGVKTGSHVVIQWRPALETIGFFAVILLSGLWLAGHRASSMQLRNTALAFVLGVALYAVIAEIFRKELAIYSSQFGFFPNRNHTGTYLAMGSVCGLGVILQSLKDRHFWRLGLSILGTCICLWAAFQWSVSRGGVLLIAIGSVLWLPMIGRRYLGKHGSKAIVLLALLIIGGYLLNESQVKKRLSDTSEKIAAVAENEDPSAAEPSESENSPTLSSVDFRVPMALDALDMIKDAPLTGVGAGQFVYVFPQYRTRTAIVNDAIAYHPESDWLWIISECGIGAALILLAMTLLALGYGVLSIFKGRDRAIRAACLIAAILVPLHGIADVPGHRLPLALASFLLFTVSLIPSRKSENHRNNRSVRLSIQLFGLFPIFFGICLLLGKWPTGNPIALQMGTDEYGNARKSFVEVTNPPADEDFTETFKKLTTARNQLKSTIDRLPLDPWLRRLDGNYASLFAGNESEVKKLFEIEGTLSPTSVQVPMRQAETALANHPSLSAEAWSEALQRSSWLDNNLESSFNFKRSTIFEIRRMSYRYPQLRKMADEVIRAHQ
ncbi:O-antigen ligase family protein [Luteolibacter pohnpeiensis]|uniref:O-antigen ligase family protein n=1 Tax=Luteolibacter pohnpeiensis TaxID=454153 RepID=A0A934S888_9BACT|nr:O-antigen ligase family protein [Luteolibacter pohnpeiensis]MBK1883049.1 O-antigen ligase family protein [Luteolibacter pohnpeiensis]